LKQVSLDQETINYDNANCITWAAIKHLAMMK